MCSCRFNSPKPFTQWRILLLRNLQALFFPSVLHFFPFLFSCNNWFTDKSIYPGLMISAKSTFDKQPHWATTLPTVKLQQTFPERWAKHSKYKKNTKTGTTLRVAGNEGVVWCGMPGEERGVQGGSPKSQALCAAWHWALLPQHGASISAHPLLGCASWQTNRNSREKEKPSQCRDWVISKEAENELRRIECFQIVFSNDRCICVCLNLDFM